MASKSSAPLALFLVLNLLFFSLVASCGNCPSPNPNPRPTPNPRPNPNPRPTPNPRPNPNPRPTPNPNPTPPSSSGKCPVDALKLGVCADVLGSLLNITLGKPPTTPCCSLLGNLVNLEAAVCLCTALKANILGINLNIPISLSLLLNVCGKNAPKGFQCP